MSFRKNQNIKNVQAKLKLHIDELEDNLKYDKDYWESYNLDKVSIKNVIEDHHLEILHHIEQIKYHLDKVILHKQRVDEIDHNLSVEHKKSTTPVQEGDESLFNQGDAIRRPEEDKLRLKVKRAAKTSSLKYVLQWENIMEEQKVENVFNPVTYRNKNINAGNTDASTSQMVKNRIEKFEGFQKPKRQSSTIETFLDFSGDKPRRIKSYPIIEDTEGEKESDVVIKTIDSTSEQGFSKKETTCDKENGLDVEELNSYVKSDDENEQKCSVVLKNVEHKELTKPRIIEMHIENMGNKFSGPQLQRNKSLSTFGRSSQRGLFQKTKAKLKTIEKKIQRETNHDEIRNELEAIEKELLNVSNTIKEKNKDRYEEIMKYFGEVQSKVSEKREEIKLEGDAKEVMVEDAAKEVKAEGKAKEVQVNDTEDVEIRKPIEFYERPSSPSIKFGVQVMPIKPRVSQELLKRNTIPNSEEAKIEFQKIRAMSSDAKVYTQSTITTSVMKDGVIQEYSTRTSLEGPFQLKSDLNQVEKIRTAVDELEGMIKYFHGTKQDEEYQTLRSKLILNSAKLENIEPLDHPVMKQERKILIQRIQELLQILERVSEPIVAVIHNSENEDADSENSASAGTAI
ncbi:hypothetical protein FQR65_LT12004 [Abscondita terminalis]|nr:hypothetical protein FQR65_LT12004 [Abscondita terminalis]